MSTLPGGWTIKRVGDFLTESRIPVSVNDKSKRLTVRLHNQGVEKRDERDGDTNLSTLYFVRRAGQFIYGKQNIFRGAIGLIPEEFDGFHSTQDIPAFDIESGIYPKWLYYYFSRPSFYKSLELMATGTGSKRVHPTELFKVKISTPSFTEQQKIAEILGSVDEAIGVTRRVIEQMRQLKRSMLQQLLTEGIPGRHTKFKDSPLGRIPAEWTISTLQEMAVVQTGYGRCL